jgi:rod shape-determining protein MreB and related proteins
MLDFLSALLAPPIIAVDLGTANTRVYARASDTLTEQPSTLSMMHSTSPTVTDEYLQHTNRQLTNRPLRGGVIVDMKNAISLLKPLLRQTRQGFLPPVSLATAPSDTSRLERARLQQALLQAGAKKVCIIPEVWAAALGAGIDVDSRSAQLLVDIGDGVTDMAVFRRGRITAATSIRVACSDLQRAVRSRMITAHRVRISDSEAERLTNCLDALQSHRENPDACLELSALDIVQRKHRPCRVLKHELALAMEPVLDRISVTIATGLQRLPEQWREEIGTTGICLTGGGACISGMSDLLAARTGLGVRVAVDPLHAVINGAIRTLELRQGEREWWANLAWPDFSA